jgi:hypothetical protein
MMLKVDLHRRASGLADSLGGDEAEIVHELIAACRLAPLDLSGQFPDTIAAWLRDPEMNPPDMFQRKQIADVLTRLWLALMMVRDADEDCKRDGLATMPPFARSRVDEALSPTGKAGSL